MDYLHLDAGRRISHRAAGSFLRLVVLVDMRGEALNPADDFILHSAIFCLDYVSRHIWTVLVSRAARAGEATDRFRRVRPPHGVSFASSALNVAHGRPRAR